jgi:regulatory protein
LLARREHSRLELERKLRARGFDDIAIGDTLDSLEGEGSLADERFAESFVRSRAARGQGPVRIRMELVERGIDAAQAAQRLRAAELDWHALARRARSKRFGESPPKEYAERARQARFLQYRGFDADQVGAALESEADSD